MADVRIDDLPSASVATGTEVAPVVQNDVTVRMTTQAIADLAAMDLGTSDSWFTTGDVVGGEIILDIDTNWGINAAGQPYFDAAGAAAGEGALLWFTDDGIPFLIPLGE